MSYSEVDLRPVIQLDEDTRGDFIVRVYQHLLGAIAAFVGFEALLFATGIAESIYDFLAGSGGVAWLLILGGFMVGQMIAANAAADLLNPGKQYAALFGSALLQAFIFAPFLYYAFNAQTGGTATVGAAAVLTAVGFAGLTVIAFITRKDLSFIRPMLMFGGIAAMVAIGGAVIFGFELGIWFSVAMIALAGGSILYQTQAIVRTYPVQAHVAAALALFSSVMTLFWYVLRLLMQLRQ
ncbi:MAG: Bax inhibitor-1 family protein [Actinomycetota bacterium]